ncbi:hypothetical protein I307_05808 [Cryptococcus deuterogattii 99/473]|uniref:Mannosyltransferase n=1 Tax=Cryptococcus deuterogattii Ram5 TaxID=1296110 RepID=A0A0D0UY28_9TREE|nr:hypothetical protein I313_06368 [Cryptococcus deuterogattii Ram5]KIY54826.1 hypothetical protein I307_05808 [Cryptococcus deuterogattii 99/473]
MHTPSLWHYAISIPFYLLGITPTLSALRLTCLFQALLLPTILSLTLTPTPSPTPFFPRRFINVFRKPKDYALTIGLNSMVVLMASRFTPGISCLLGLLVLWRSVLKRRYWIGAGVATVIGIMRAGVMVWAAFVLGWVAWGKDWSGIGDFYAFTQLTQPMLPVWAPYSPYLLRHFRWTLLWAFATLCSYTVSDNSRNRVSNTVGQCLPLIILRLYLLFLGDKPKESAPAIDGRDGQCTTVAGGELEAQEQVKGGIFSEEIRQPQTARAAEEGNERGERSQQPNRRRIEAGWYTLISLVAGSLLLIIGG